VLCALIFWQDDVLCLRVERYQRSAKLKAQSSKYKAQSTKYKAQEQIA
jgi:hypothetical protein